jgi:hypothetical protein
VNERIKNLRDAVEAARKCKALHDQSVPVREMFGDKDVWEDVVEKFALLGQRRSRLTHGAMQNMIRATKYAL